MRSKTAQSSTTNGIRLYSSIDTFYGFIKVSEEKKTNDLWLSSFLTSSRWSEVRNVWSFSGVETHGSRTWNKV